MATPLRSEVIYDAVLDDGAFAALPAILAEAYGARSCLLHWAHNGLGTSMMAHNGYYPDEELLNLDRNFGDADIWTSEAARPERLNQVVNLDEVVSPAEYERSLFYNEWVRGMGDDTFHCLGTVIETQWGLGCVGLHRGRGQGAFSADQVKAMQDDVVHLRRMVTMRGSLAADKQRAATAEAVLDSAGDAFITVTAEGKIVHANASGEAIVRRSDGLSAMRGALAAQSGAADRALKRAIDAASASSGCAASAVAVPRREGGQYNLAVSPLRNATGRNLVLIALRDPDRIDNGLERRLGALYGLSSAEAAVAVRLAGGASPSDIARARGVSPETVRKQLKSICEKLNCRRQGEIVATVLSLPPIGRR